MMLEQRAAPKLANVIGRAGYSIYALHAPTLHMLLLLGLPWIGCAAACLVVGLCSFYLIERPLDRIGHAINKRSWPQIHPVVQSASDGKTLL